MAFSAKAGTFNSNTSTGNQAVTGVGFQPKIVLFFETFQSAAGTTTDLVRMIGVGVSSTSRQSSSGWSGDGLTTSDCECGTSNVRCGRLADTTGTVVHNMDFVSQDADGFTVNWTTANGTARIIHYLALGGSDLSAWCDQINSKTTTGNQAYTGVGFQPTALILVKENGQGSTQTAGGQVTIASSIGFATGTSARGYMAEIERNAQTTMDSARQQRTGSCYGVWNNTASLMIEADFVSFDSDGFTLNWTTANGTARTVIAIALAGINAKVGSFNQRNGSGSQSVTGVGFLPSALLLTGYNDVANEGGSSVDCDSYFGWATGSAARGCCWKGARDGVTTSECDRAISSTACIQDRAVGTGTLTVEADFTSFDSDGFTVNYGTGDATARQNLFLALGQVGAGGGAVPVPSGLALLGVGN